jgi:hypothetical protein
MTSKASIAFENKSTEKNEHEGKAEKRYQRKIAKSMALVSMAIMTKGKQLSTFEIRRFNET